MTDKEIADVIGYPITAEQIEEVYIGAGLQTPETPEQLRSDVRAGYLTLNDGATFNAANECEKYAPESCVLWYLDENHENDIEIN